jgi:hypothetical protein
LGIAQSSKAQPREPEPKTKAESSPEIVKALALPIKIPIGPRSIVEKD